MKNPGLFFLGALLLFLAGCASNPPLPPLPPNFEPEPAVRGCKLLERGLASWYGNELLGNRTANGEMFKPEGVTAAHRTLPFGTRVKVMLDEPYANPDGVSVRINDRGPFVKGRIIDLSRGASRILNMPQTSPVRVYDCGQD